MRRIVIWVVTLFFLSTAVGAEAVNYVNVTLKVAEGSYYLNKVTCPVTVLESADGVAVLEAAKASGCISSYELVHFSFGAFVNCIDGVCTDPPPTYLRYWAMRDYGPEIYSGGPHRCDPTSYGVSDYQAFEGGQLSFTFETFVTGSLPVTC